MIPKSIFKGFKPLFNHLISPSSDARRPPELCVYHELDKLVIDGVVEVMLLQCIRRGLVYQHHHVKLRVGGDGFVKPIQRLQTM
jgi:hypothetical protein